MSAEAAEVLAPDVEYRLRQLVQDASKFMRHAKRTTLTTTDVNNALLARGCEPMYGFRGGHRDATRFVEAAGHPHVFYVEDAIMDVAGFVAKPLPAAIPREPGMAAHYLAWQGVQPRIPQNLQTSSAAGRPAAKAPAAAKRKTRDQLQPAASDAPPSKALALAESGGKARIPHGTAAVTPGAVLGPADGVGAPALPPSENLPALAHHVPEQMQTYLKKVTDVLTAGAPKDRLEAVLNSLREDPGISSIVPYLVYFLCERVKAGVAGKDAGVRLKPVLDAAARLLVNTAVDLVPYLHQLVPAVLSCACSKRADEEVRQSAAKLAAQICDRFGDDARYALRQRMAQTYAQALGNAKKPAAARCGALWGLYHLGARTLHAAFLPHARALAEIAATAGVPDFKAVLETCAVTAARLIEEAWRIGPSGGQPPVAKAPAEPSAWDAALAAARSVCLVYCGAGEEPDQTADHRAGGDGFRPHQRRAAHRNAQIPQARSGGGQ